MKRVVVTGGTGFVGANLCRRLLEEGHEVHCLLRPEYSRWRIEKIRQELNLHIVDLTDESAVASVISKIRPEWIFHLAAHGAYSWQRDLKQIVQTNILATINLVEASLKTGFEIFINTGSSSEYGFKDHAPTEEEWLDPNSYYAVTKASATLYCKYTSNRYNVPIPTVRLYSVYGAYEDPGRLIPTMILHGMKGQLPPLVDSKTARDYIHIKDVENAYLLLAAQRRGQMGEVYNLGTGIQTSLEQVVNVARDMFNLSVEPRWGTMPNREWDSTVWKANNTRITALGWQAQFTFEQGFRQTVDWFQNDPEIIKYYRDAVSE